MIIINTSGPQAKNIQRQLKHIENASPRKIKIMISYNQLSQKKTNEIPKPQIFDAIKATTTMPRDFKIRKDKIIRYNKF